MCNEEYVQGVCGRVNVHQRISEGFSEEVFMLTFGIGEGENQALQSRSDGIHLGRKAGE